METAICTLFENHYHYGLAALTNSLVNNGFQGTVYAGYRGSLPEWTGNAVDASLNSWANAKTLDINGPVKIVFLPLETDFHLANYKPDFMLRLWEGPARNADAMVYFDPDIVIKCNWSFYERWLEHGVALVHEVISNDMPLSHPIRKGWEKVIKSCGMKPSRKIRSYINSGFCGVSIEHIEFLKVWSLVIDVAIKQYGLSPNHFAHSNRTDLFFAGDQDAFNIAAMCSESPISELGPEGMDFVHGGWTMSHAIGSPKPWKKNFLMSALKGQSPSMAEKEFWNNVDGPLHTFAGGTAKSKRLAISISSFIGRFYRRY